MINILLFLSTFFKLLSANTFLRLIIIQIDLLYLAIQHNIDNSNDELLTVLERRLLQHDFPENF